MSLEIVLMVQGKTKLTVRTNSTFEPVNLTKPQVVRTNDVKM